MIVPSWPSVKLLMFQMILHILCLLVAGVASYPKERRKEGRGQGMQAKDQSRAQSMKEEMDFDGFPSYDRMPYEARIPGNALFSHPVVTLLVSSVRSQLTQLVPTTSSFKVTLHLVSSNGAKC